MSSMYRCCQYLQELDNKVLMLANELTSEKYLTSGWGTIISATETEIGTHAFEEIFLPTANTSLQISSSAPADVNLFIRITGYDQDFNLIEETVNLDPVSGQNPVSLINQYFRIIDIINDSTISNSGNIFLSIDGSPLAAGIPTLQTNYIYSMGVGYNKGSISNLCIPPIRNGVLNQKYLSFAVTQVGGSSITIRISYKPTYSQVWITDYEFAVNILIDSEFQYNLNGKPPLSNADLNTPSGYDYRVTMSNNGFGSVTCATQLALSQYSA